MPKQRRAAASRSAARPAPRKSSSRGSKPAPSSSRGSDACRTDPRIEADPSIEVLCGYHIVKARRTRERTVAPKVAVPVAPAAPPPPRRPAFYEALTVYESGVRALQRHDFIGRRQLSGGHPTVSG